MKKKKLVYNKALKDALSFSAPAIMSMYDVYTRDQAEFFPLKHRKGYAWFREMGFVMMLEQLQLLSKADKVSLVQSIAVNLSGSGEDIFITNNESESVEAFPSDVDTRHAPEEIFVPVREWEEFFENNYMTPSTAIEGVIESVELLDVPFAGAVALSDRMQNITIGAIDALYALGCCSWEECVEWQEKHIEIAIDLDMKQVLNKEENEVKRNLIKSIYHYRDLSVATVKSDVAHMYDFDDFESGDDDGDDEELEKLLEEASDKHFVRIGAYVNYFTAAVKDENGNKYFTDEEIRLILDNFKALGLYLPPTRIDKAIAYRHVRRKKWMDKASVLNREQNHEYAMGMIKHMANHIAHRKKQLPDNFRELVIIGAYGTVDAMASVGLFEDEEKFLSERSYYADIAGAEADKVEAEMYEDEE